MMTQPLKLERWSWIAGIAGAIIALIAFVVPLFNGNSTPPASSVTQQAGPNSTQIANNSGTVIIGASPQNGPVDFEGNWNLNRADSIAIALLQKKNWETDDFGTPPYIHTSLGVFNLLYKDHQSTVLAYQTAPQDYGCHACAPFLSFFEFEKRSLGWKLVDSEVAAVQEGSWGGFAKENISVRVIGDDLYGVFLEDGYLAQGYSFEWTTVFARIGDSFHPILKLMLSESSGGAEDPATTDWSSTIDIKPATTGLYDIVVERKGKLRWIDGTEELKRDTADADGNVHATDTFKFDGVRYARSDIFR
jgi:hypothetical protein